MEARTLYQNACQQFVPDWQAYLLINKFLHPLLIKWFQMFKIISIFCVDFSRQMGSNAIGIDAGTT
jgi:hypothetical protein